MQEIQDMLNRMDYLATQSANGTYDNEVDRAALQKEVDQLKSEINRIADSANFNGIKLLDGSMDGNARAAVEATESTAAGMLPDVGQILGKDTVLHAEEGTAPDKTSFSVDLHNLEISGAKGTEFNITIGDVTLTGTLAKDFTEDAPLEAADIVAALADSTVTNKVSFKIGTTAYDSTDFTVNGAKFEADTASTGSRITFTSDESVDPEMKVEVKLADGTDPGNKPVATFKNTAGTAAGPGFTAGTQGNGTPATGATSNWQTGTDKLATGDAGKIAALTTLNVGGHTVDLSKVTGLTDGTTTIDDAMAAITAEIKKQVAEANTAAAKGTTTYNEVDVDSITVTGTATGFSVAFDQTPQTYSATAVAAKAATAEVDFGTNTGADVIGKSITVGDKTYQFVAAAGDAAAGNTAVVVADADTAAQLATKLVTAAKADAPTGVTAATGITSAAGKVTFATTATGADAKIEAKDATAPIDAPKLKGDYNVSTTNLEKKGEAAGERLASTYFDLSKAMAANGNQITIGKETYTFTTDEDKKGDAGMVYVGDLDLSKKADLVEAAERLTKAAAGNKTYTVGHDGKRMTFTENKGQTEFEDKEALNTYENIEKSFGFKTAGKEAVEADDSRALTLQIGDTSEDYNQLKVSIGDMHTEAMGIADLNIGNQTDAAAAIQTIRDAINYVSGVRGDLGATQNRLEHTANNLSVMAENIQDAESTIRDTDIAEEMMSYTKNNILVQSAQAMLAQANQVPQGVLQLLG